LPWSAAWATIVVGATLERWAADGVIVNLELIDCRQGCDARLTDGKTTLRLAAGTAAGTETGIGAGGGSARPA